MTQVILDKGVEVKSERLSGKTIAVGACGGIGAVELVKLFRELRRHGASVKPFVTPSVFKFITETSLSWAADAPVVSEADESVEHFERYDLVLVAPATLNTISKCAAGLADNAVTLLVAAALGQSPVVMVPTMNLRLLRHPSYEAHRERLKTWKVNFFESALQEDRLKMPASETLVEYVIRILEAA